jgi:hypothetical protein
MTKLVITLTIFLANNLYAQDFFSIPENKFQIKSVNALEKLELTLKYPEKFLKRFKPEGAIITEKFVSNNNIRFIATKKVLFISKSALVNGNLDSFQENTGCAKNEIGFKLVLNFDGSDGIVVDNIDRLEAKICATNIGTNQLIGSVKGRIYKGNNYSSAVGMVAKDIIEAQINPLLRALTEEIQK